MSRSASTTTCSPRSTSRNDPGSWPRTGPASTTPRQAFMHPDTVLGTDLGTGIENAAREALSVLLDPEIPPAEIDLDADMAGSYSLTSLNKVLFLTEVCEAT